MTVAAITAVLGGKRVLKYRNESAWELTRLTREGLPLDAFTKLALDYAVERKVLARIIGISERTLSRRAASGERLSAEESDRLVRTARVFALATDTFDTSKKASLWLQTQNRVLDGRTPLELLDTDTGVGAVETVLGRIAWGVYS